ncbi:uncharacterized protein RSE6_02536 [Rhynchosporium secalis]|uniref:Uncharacterized protein n=1 Tax=Rhynchosporium secalis TaxID=38038 RepID=A0A1E1M0I8_RHYSE|nr:uncharacterized protein RSE6_02536 [Rhynchosporium secalis]
MPQSELECDTRYTSENVDRILHKPVNVQDAPVENFLVDKSKRLHGIKTQKGFVRTAKAKIPLL